MTRRAFWTLALAALALTACYTGGRRQSSSTPNQITRAQLEALEVMSAYDAIQRLRPNWLSGRGPTTLAGGPTLPQVHINDSRGRGLDELRTMPVVDVELMQYRNATDATTLYGTGYPGGVIEVHTRR